MKRLLVIGNSHVEAVGQRYQADLAEGRTPAMPIEVVNVLEPEFRPLLEGGVLNAAVVARLDHPDNGLVVSMLGGNDHNVLGLVNHPIPFDFVLPERPDLPLTPGADPIPSRLVRDQLRRRMEILSYLKVIRDHARQPMIHLESPPPIPDEDHIRRHPRIFRESIAEHGVAPAVLRYKLWRVHSEIFREACEAADITFLPVPADMQDADGMMIPGAWNPDPTHGNLFYGARLIEQLVDYYRRSVEAPSPSPQATGPS